MRKSSDKMENDQQIGITDGEPVSKPQLSPDEIKENDAMMQLFKQIAGTDEEVDWKELKEILDYYTKKEETQVAMNVDGVGAAPVSSTPNTNENHPLTSLLALLCGVMCKDTSLADVVPAPTQDISLNNANEMKGRGFSKDVCRSMIAMLDSDRTGKLNFEEFKRLWTMIRTWKSVFNTFDKNRSGSLSGFELRQALTSAGYTLNNHTLNILMHRYGNKFGEIEFDDFIMCAVKLKIMIELFKEMSSTTGLDRATFTLEDWVENTLYA